MNIYDVRSMINEKLLEPEAAKFFHEDMTNEHHVLIALAYSTAISAKRSAEMLDKIFEEGIPEAEI